MAFLRDTCTGQFVLTIDGLNFGNRAPRVLVEHVLCEAAITYALRQSRMRSGSNV